MRKNPNLPFVIFGICAVLWFTRFPWLTSADTGTAANIEWLVSTAVALTGIVCLVWGVRSRIAKR